MTETLFAAYLPLVLWTGIGLVCVRFVPSVLPRLLGRTLYWVGVPWQVFALARRTDFSQNIGLVPIVTIVSLLLGISLALLSLQGLKQWTIARNPADSPVSTDSPLESTALELPFLVSAPISFATLTRAQQGSFILAATIGNTGFVGLGLIPSLISQPAWGWAVFYSVTHNVVGTYGIGVFLASYFGRSQQENRWWTQLRDVLTVPSLWAFAIGALTRPLPLPLFLEKGLQASLWIVIPSAFLLMGMRLSQLRLQSLRMAFVPMLLKVLALPALVGIGVTSLGLSGDPRLALVLMTGMPSAFAGLILAEEYDLDRELIASSITVTTIALVFTIPIWLTIFH